MNRRGRHEGSIYQRRDGLWVASLSLGARAGKRRRRTMYGRTKSEVLAKLRLALRAKEDGLDLTDDRLTIAQFLDRWFNESAVHSIRASTAESYARIIRLHIAPEIGGVRLIQLGPEDVQRLINRKRFLWAVGANGAVSARGVATGASPGPSVGTRYSQRRDSR